MTPKEVRLPGAYRVSASVNAHLEPAILQHHAAKIRVKTVRWTAPMLISRPGFRYVVITIGCTVLAPGLVYWSDSAADKTSTIIDVGHAATQAVPVMTDQCKARCLVGDKTPAEESGSVAPPSIRQPQNRNVSLLSP